jgi:hypothetical protein
MQNEFKFLIKQGSYWSLKTWKVLEFKKHTNDKEKLELWWIL